MKSRSAFWFFLFLLVAGLLAAIIPYLFATWRQLDLETITRAKAKWSDQKPLDYNLTVRHDRGKSQIYRVRVRAGKTVEVLLDGSFGNDVEMHQISIPTLFDQLQDWAEYKSRFDYLVADFHPAIGYPVRIVWRKAGGVREEWVIRLDALPSR
ncbi:MAG: hypothetical protein EBS30_07835 [Planctomycetes bacterium]|nr:hypothetical protein [Planctomycetota bacterium]